MEATSEEFYVWSTDNAAIEKTQLLAVEGARDDGAVAVYGVVNEVYRRSRRRDILEEADRFDGRPESELPPVESRGVSYARVRVLGTRPQQFTACREEDLVRPAGVSDARTAYGLDDIADPLTVGLIRNGARATVGPAQLDLDFLLGANGGHMNVNGVAGVATKSSMLTIVVDQLLRRAAVRSLTDADALALRPVIFNVKGYDLFWLDHWSTALTAEDVAAWAAMGVTNLRPMNARFFAPQQPGSTSLPVPIGRYGVTPYSWSLADVLTGGLFGLLFSDTDRGDDNFALLLADIERSLVDERQSSDGRLRREVRPSGPARSFRQLFDWFSDGLSGVGDDAFARLEHGHHHPGTLRRFYRRLRRIAYEGAGIFRLDDAESHPLDITTQAAGEPLVVDLHALSDRHLQRFVVAALLRQAIDDQTGPHARRGTVYAFVLDELNRFAPRGASDPITELIEMVAAEMRSRGIILLGAQQQASLVSTRVVENAAIRLLGRTGGHELRSDVHAYLPESLRSYVGALEAPDKVLHTPTIREPMHIRVPRPPWAMRRAEAGTSAPSVVPDGASIGARARRLPARRWEDLPR
jgi:hypothetical protein